MVDLLNFSFWSDKPYHVTFDNVNYSGYWSICAAINKSMAAGIPILEASYWTNGDFSDLFMADFGEIPMISERIRILRESGEIIMKKFNGSIVNLVNEAKGDAIKLINLLCCNFHSFLDICSYEGEVVCVLKRAQIFVADLWACFDDKTFGKFGNSIDHITMFADYRIPQILQSFDILQLSDQFALKLKNDVLFNVHENEVIEIRAASIKAVELLRQTINQNHNINAIVIDFFLWDLTKSNPELLKDIPIHKTRSYFY